MRAPDSILDDALVLLALGEARPAALAADLAHQAAWDADVAAGRCAAMWLPLAPVARPRRGA